MTSLTTPRWINGKLGTPGKAGNDDRHFNAPSDVVQIAPHFSRKRTVASLYAMGAPLTDLTAH